MSKKEEGENYRKSKKNLREIMKYETEEQQTSKAKEVSEEIKQRETPKPDNPPPYQDNDPFRSTPNNTNPFRVGFYL